MLIRMRTHTHTLTHTCTCTVDRVGRQGAEEAQEVTPPRLHKDQLASRYQAPVRLPRWAPTPGPPPSLVSHPVTCITLPTFLLDPTLSSSHIRRLPMSICRDK
uniref:Uncharacterized protein n=1 Tax=Cacopsylla melanoneura TaxID=428564 RepID=A0A8D8ZRT2_9HEMI